MAKESGAWLQALPISSLGLRLDDTYPRIAVGLRLRTAICAAHQCHHCGVEVSGRGFHGLSCRHCEGRHHRHGTVNSIIHKTLVAAKIPSQPEPAGLFIEQTASAPTGWPLSHGLVASCWSGTPPALTPSLRHIEPRQQQQQGKLQRLQRTGRPTTCCDWDFGPFGPKSLAFVKELGGRIREQTGEEMPTSYLIQRLSMAVQRGNVAAVLGSLGQR